MDTLIRDHNVDPEQIYITGWSNGGFMSYRLGCQLGDRIRGVIPFVGALGIKYDFSAAHWDQVDPFSRFNPYANLT